MANCRLEYVFGPQKPNFGHCLGVNSLQLSPDIVLTPESHGTLFSGGRDGRLNAWSLTKDGAQNTLMTECHTNNVSGLLPISDSVVASCSTDTTVKLWNVKTDNVQMLGHHSDYAECLSRFSDNVMCSGGLDGRLIGWDLEAQKQAFDLKVNHSVYTVAAVPNRFLLTGSPDGCIRIWDPRQANHTMKLVGHSDSVRSLLVADNGQYLVSGSSDATAILWNLRINRAVRTSNVFESSVWSLTKFKDGFLAGDRNGSIYQAESMTSEPKLVIDNKNEKFFGLKGICHDEKNEELWLSTQFNPTLYRTDLKAQVKDQLEGHTGLKKHRVLNDKRRSLILDTAGKVSMVDLISAKPIAFDRQIDMNDDLDDQLDKILEEVNTMDVLDNWCQVQIKAGQISVVLDGRSVHNTEIYLDELLEYVSTTTKSPLSTPAISPVSSGFFKQISPAVSRVTSTQSLTEVLQKERTAKITSQNQLHSRGQSLDQSLDQNPSLGGRKGKAKFYNPEDESDSDSDNDDDDDSTSSFKDTASTNAPPTPKSPKPKSVRLPPPDVQPTIVETEEPADQNTVDDEIRINLGNFVLENLLRGVIDRLHKQYTQIEASKPPAETPVQASKTSTQGSNDTAGGFKKTKKRGFLKKLFGKKSRDEPPKYNPERQTDSPAPSIQRQKDQKNVDMSKEADSKSFMDAWNRAIRMRSFEAADPEAPGHDIVSKRTKIIVTLTQVGGAPTEVFSTTVGKLIDNETESEKIEHVLPGWVGDAVLLGKLHLRKPTKIGFSVDSDDPKLPSLANSDTRLMAISMLRARKIMTYIVGQLQSDNILSAKASEVDPEELIQLKCADKDVSPLTTLATIRTRIWRHGGDVKLNYSLKRII